MGGCFQNEYGVEEDCIKQFEYFVKAANVGHVEGKRQVGHCIEEGIETEPDTARGAKFYKTAAEAVDVEAL